MDDLFANPVTTIAAVRDAFEVTYKTAQNAVDNLVAKGVLIEFSGRRRDRLYWALDIVHLIEAPLEDILPTAGDTDTADEGSNRM